MVPLLRSNELSSNEFTFLTGFMSWFLLFIRVPNLNGKAYNLPPNPCVHLSFPIANRLKDSSLTRLEHSRRAGFVL